MDGLSVAGSVAGIISLGIQVTQSLAEYYEAYKRRESYIAATAAKLAKLLRLLESLQSQLISRKFSAVEKSLLDDIEESIRMCEDNIRALEITIKTFDISAGNSNRAAFRAKVLYPLKESTLRKLDVDIDEIVSYLSLALAALENGVVNAIRNDIEDAKAILDLVRATQISSDIRAWLKAPDATTNYNDACKLRHPRTGLWFVEGCPFSTWLVNPNSFLWLNGFSGCGKSVLCSTAIQYSFRHRRSSPTTGLAFFFFAFNDVSKQDASAMLRALILQLSSQLNDNHTLLTRLYDRYRDSTPPDHDLKDCLHQLLRAFKHVYIILDALDESPRHQHGKNLRQSVLEVLVLMRKWSQPGLHLLVTSRDEPDIRRDVLLDDLHAPQTELSMKNTSVDSDIASFISGCLKDRREMRKWEKYHDQIERALLQRSGGM